MARTWLAIKVELISGRGEDLWPRPGRIFAAARSHTFQQLGDAINEGFGRWDLSHLSQFTLGDGTLVGSADPDLDPSDEMVEARRTKLSRLERGEQFAFTFDFGDDWEHLCTTMPERIDPLEVIGVVASRPVAIWGWGAIPDQYGRRWEDDDGEGPVPPDPGRADLPPVLDARWGQAPPV